MKESALQNRTDWKERLVGIEFENPVVDEDGEPVTFSVIQEVWKTFSETGWRVTIDHYYKVISGVEKDFNGNIVSLISDNGAGNLEMALPPLDSVVEGEKLLATVRGEILQTLSTHRLHLLGLAIQPGRMAMPIEERRVKSFIYKGFEGALGSTARHTHCVMTPHSAHQTGVSVRIQEVIPVTNALIAATGLIIALCGNSPIQNWTILPWKEWRMIAWYFRFMGEKPGFGKLARFPDKPFSSLANLLTYFWDTPSIILPPIQGEDFLFPKPPINYLQYFTKPYVFVTNLAGQTMKRVPSPADINFAMICMWPFAKPHIVMDPKKAAVTDFMEHLRYDTLEAYLVDKLLNCYIEYRGAATAPIGEEITLPALILGLVNNLAPLQELINRFAWDEWGTLVYTAAARGMDASICSESVVPLLAELVSIAEDGLKKRPYNETPYLAPLKKRIQTRKNPADIAVEKFKKNKKEFLDYITYR